ncbi:hypothetical protein B7494_g5911 [Chlorociboria aeruginascens]|nr:hypothetical protein B7494_g5911 [Chlorociboria aeruginascens]
MPPLKNFLAVSFLLVGALAVPNVTTELAPGGCSAYPVYDASIGIAGPWILQLSDSDNSAIDGYGDDSQVIRQAGSTGITQGRISIVNNNQLAKNAIRCNDATGLEGYVATGVSGYTWQQLNITEYPYDAELMYGLGQYSTPVEAYYHYIDGVQQPGLYLGQDGYTTWGVKLYPADSGSLDGNPYWQLRLLGPDSGLPWLNNTALYPDEYETFLTVEGS